MTEAAQAFTSIVAKIPKARREELRPLIQRVQEALGSKDDLFVDGRKKMWAEGGSARTTTLVRQASTATKPEPKTHKVSWRNGGTIECTTAEAVKLSRRKSAGALAVTLSKHKGVFHFKDEDDIATVTRI
jgi:16S rRNA G1207 methylase RsmC